MTSRVRLAKEARNLAPFCIGTLLLIIVPCLIWQHHAGPIVGPIMGLGCALMAAYAFGSEFQHRTLSLLLSQPLPRRVVWREKMLVLAGAQITAVAMACLMEYFWPQESPGWMLVLVSLCLFCGAPYWTLASGQSLVGTFVAIGFPTTLLVAGAGLLAAGAKWINEPFFSNERLALCGAITLLLVYCVIIFWRGKVRFEQLELGAGTAKEIRVPAKLEGLFESSLLAISNQFKGAIATLLSKELRLQRTILLGAGVFSFVACAGALLFPVFPEFCSAVLSADYAIYLLVFPFVVGAVTTAEEKEWGIAEWHLTLPPSSAKQWLVKLCTSFGLLLVLGIVLPAMLLLMTGGLFAPPEKSIPHQIAAAVGPVFLAQVFLSSLALYSGSISSGTMRAIILSFIGLLVLTFCAWLGQMTISALCRPAVLLRDSFLGIPSLWWWFLAAAIIIYSLILQWSAFLNFRQSPLEAQYRKWQIAVLCCLATISAGAMTLLYGVV